MEKRRVIIETPFAGNIGRNIRYTRACMRDCLINHNEIPFASHLLYTQGGILNDNDARERNLGIESGLVWAEFAETSVVYTDLGISGGMKLGIETAEKKGRKVEYRTLGEDWEKESQELLNKSSNHPFVINKVNM